MQVTTSVIDVQHCPPEVIKRHLDASGPSYSLYHHNAYQIYVSESGQWDEVIGLIDNFIDMHREALEALNYDECSDNPDEPIRITLQIEIPRNEEYPKYSNFPGRLIANLWQTGMLLEFCPSS